VIEHSNCEHAASMLKHGLQNYSKQLYFKFLFLNTSQYPVDDTVAPVIKRKETK